ncbi:MAG: NAD-dependent deacylase [Sphingobacteriales bacterium]|jgi:NAD-dependent deacetylase|nr:NAD-dependent deacylase [Sphingobacteriales bacterium]MBP9141665.1 NAD-dependent deacylase [Chitinophagales bacterium]MDA0197482.1 NAD-dependent deacylase [Bacteroidota bacterium]MBK6890331.1 NAD-dependent deacylase [Sphingobacteriales bacterium]MBK7526616.1 NAD-dependent deacylase [Sphingobacteriales bacterium]
MKNDKDKIVVLTGAGISAESGLATFRDSDGLWNNYDIEDVATIEAFNRNPKLVLDFYNWRRAEAAKAQPNAAHIALANLAKHFNVNIITQNVDDLHERAGSANVLHLHGKLREVRSTANPNLVYDIDAEPIFIGSLCQQGAQLRPNIVWFGEDVPKIAEAIVLVEAATKILVVGSSLQVYPAAGLLHYAPKNAPIFLVDPKYVDLPYNLQKRVTVINAPATIGVTQLVEEWISG